MNPWDVQDLVGRLKGRGLDMAEKEAGIVAEEVMAWTRDSIVNDDSKLDDMVLPALPLIEAQLKKLIDGINGKIDNP